MYFESVFGSLLSWTFGDELLHELGVGDAPVIISIKTLSDQDQVLLARIDTILGENPAKLPAADIAV